MQHGGQIDEYQFAKKSNLSSHEIAKHPREILQYYFLKDERRILRSLNMAYMVYDLFKQACQRNTEQYKLRPSSSLRPVKWTTHAQKVSASVFTTLVAS